ncbi:MAG: hypothetical protein K5771_07595 [Oscillospiraceae bacterium]|nr:hypothetical protein [Oscillospiraceae bacterium]
MFSDAAGENQIEAPIVISTTAHVLEHREAVEQTCTEQGNIECWVCQNCETPFSDANGTSAIEWEDVFLDAPGHDLTPVAEKPATCTMAGISAYWQCSVCGDLFSDSEGTESITTAAAISALGHDYAAVVTDPTCTGQGYTTHTCSRCGDSYADTYTDSLGHIWGEPEWNWQGIESADATFTCERVPDHTETVEADSIELQEELCVEPDIDEDVAGKDVYMATVIHEGTEYTDYNEVPVLLTPELPEQLFLSDGIGLDAEEAETVRELLNAYLSDHPATYNDDGLDGTYSFEGNLLEVVSTSSNIPDGTFEVTVTFDPVNNAFDSVSATTQIYIIKPLSDG